MGKAWVQSKTGRKLSVPALSIAVEAFPTLQLHVYKRARMLVTSFMWDEDFFRSFGRISMAFRL